ncbi:lamina-associated polypeptide 2-like [Bufo gargarizans]|uniref:lamina-associated polypeptide 2-like n=1 Tax=Bufo gargarizans TaxID=30331 RepID=UPI001CF3EFED|nr:lamina-associated polypeptide 2-like [Bufo gargarizans]
MGIEETREPRSFQDIMFEGLEARQHGTFPVHKNVAALIRGEWKKPNKRVFISKNLKRKYPFKEEDSASWDRAPRIDVAISKVSRKMALPFEDMGILKDPLDKKADAFLKGAWEASTSSFRPSIASTCTARSLRVWLSELEVQLKNRSPREEILASLPTIKKAADFLADASADSVRLAAKSAALSNSARRALWIKNWSGDTASKTKLCGVPCEGEYLFGPSLDDLLDKAADRKRKFPGFQSSFPSKNRFSRSFRPFKDNQEQDRRPREDRFRGQRRSRNFFFSQSSSDKKKPDQQ